MVVGALISAEGRYKENRRLQLEDVRRNRIVLCSNNIPFVGHKQEDGARAGASS